MEAGHLLIEVLRQRVHLVLVVGAVLPKLDLGNRLIGEAGAHHEGRVTRGTTEVDQTALSEEDDVVSVHRVFVDLRLDVVVGRTVVGLEPRHVNLVVEVSDVADDGLVLHGTEVGLRHDVLVAGGGDHDVGFGACVDELLHFVALHGGLQSADRVDLADNHAASGVAEAVGRALAHITESGDTSNLARHHDVGGTADRVHAGLAAPVLVVKLALGDAVVDVDGRHGQRAILLALVQAEDTGRGLLGNALDATGELRVLVEDDVGEVTAVVEDHVERLALLSEEECLLNAPLVLLLGHALPGIHRDTRSRDGGGGVVLGGEDVAARPGHVGTEFHEGLDENSRLDGHVQATGHAGAGERLLIAVTVPQGHEAGHFGLGELNFLASPLGEVDVLDLVGQLG